MKKIIFFFLVALSISASGQTTQYGDWYFRGRVGVNKPTNNLHPGAVFEVNDSSLGTLFRLYKDGVLQSWKLRNNAAGDSILSTDQFGKLKLIPKSSLSIPWDSITGKPSNFSTTYALSNDVKDSILARLRLIDTSGMLSPYRRTSTLIQQSEVNGLGSALSGKLNLVDTASMLSGYARSGNIVEWSDVNVNNGVAGLDAGGKVPFSLLPASLMIYKGTWNASTNTPTLSDGTGVTGWIYIVSTGGTVNTGSGAVTYSAGDYAIYNGTKWERSVGTNNVASVNGQQGVVTLTTTNIGEGTNLYYTDARARAAFTAGTGISLSSGTITNTAPDQTVSLTNGGNITITGTYPNFTLTNGITNNNQLTNGAGYITGNQTITLSGDVTGSGTTAITTAIGAGKVTNTMLAGSIDYSKMNAATVPTWNQNTTGNAATATYASSAGSAPWNNYDGAVYSSGTINYMLVYNSTLGKHQDATAGPIQTFLGLGSYAYRSSGLAELSGASFTGGISGTTATFSSTGSFTNQLGVYGIGSSVFTSGTGSSVRAGAYTWMGGSGGDYGSIGYNVAYTSTSGSYNYFTTDYSSILRFDAGGFRFLTAPSGTVGTPITYTERAYLNASGFAINVPISATSADFSNNVSVKGSYSLLMYNTGNTDYAQIYFDAGILNLNKPISGTSASFSKTGSSSYVGTFANATDNLKIEIGTTTGGVNNIQSKTIAANTAYQLSINAEGGNVGIGTTTPSYTLDVNGTGRYSSEIYTNGIYSSSYGPRTSAGSIFFKNWGGTTLAYITDAGASIFGGSVTATAFYESSDLRQKTVHTTLKSSDGIDAIQYTFKPSNSEKWGYGAQQVQPILPYAVSKGEDGFLKVDYTTVHTYKIAQLEKRIAELEKLVKK